MLVLLWPMLQALQQQVAVQRAVLAGLVAALATALGALPICAARHLPARLEDSLLGFGAGVMLSATCFSLVQPALQTMPTWRPAAPWLSHAAVGLAIFLGGVAMLALDHLLPHEHFIKGREGGQARRLRRTWLFVTAIALHNLPEGLAIGVAQAGAAADHASANSLTLGIAIQDVPEGLVVATALAAAGYPRTRAVWLAMATGLIEPIGAWWGAVLVSGSAALLPWGLGCAAGAMLYVVSHEIIPESHRKGHESFATLGLLLGFVLMLLLEQLAL